MLRRAHTYHKEVVRIQAWWRGSRLRRQLMRKKQSNSVKIATVTNQRMVAIIAKSSGRGSTANKPVSGGLIVSNEHLKGRELREMPDYSTEQTRAAESRLGAFIYDQWMTP